MYLRQQMTCCQFTMYCKGRHSVRIPPPPFPGGPCVGGTGWSSPCPTEWPYSGHAALAPAQTKAREGRSRFP